MNCVFASELCHLVIAIILPITFSILFVLAAGAKDTPLDHVLEKTYDAKTGRGMPDL